MLKHSPPPFHLSSNVNYDIIPDLHALQSKWSALRDHAEALRGSRWQSHIQSPVFPVDEWPIASRGSHAVSGPSLQNQKHLESEIAKRRRAPINSLNSVSWLDLRDRTLAVTGPALSSLLYIRPNTTSCLMRSLYRGWPQLSSQILNSPKTRAFPSSETLDPKTDGDYLVTAIVLRERPKCGTNNPKRWACAWPRGNRNTETMHWLANALSTTRTGAGESRWWDGGKVFILTSLRGNLRWPFCWGPRPWRGIEKCRRWCASASRSRSGTGSPRKETGPRVTSCFGEHVG